MSAKLLSDILQTPATCDLTPERKRLLKEDAARPVNIPFGHHIFKVDFDETSTTPTSLSDDYEWLVPGLIYTIVGMDQSMLQMFANSIKKSIRCKHYVSGTQLMAPVVHPGKSNNPWMYTVQGLDRELGEQYRKFTSSYLFAKDGKITWSIRWERFEIQDPFTRLPHKIGVWVALPASKSGRRFTANSNGNSIELTVTL
jgi:hypothetical protein